MCLIKRLRLKLLHLVSRNSRRLPVAAQRTTPISPPLPPAAKSPSLDSGEFYEEYHGHGLDHLAAVHQHLRSTMGAEHMVYLVGDSSLDNKHWFFDSSRLKRGQMENPAFTAPAVNGYAGILRPPRMVQDVAFWMNHIAQERFGAGAVAALNCAVEESALSDRSDGLMWQDAFVRDVVTANDVIVVSLGGNDVALKPTVWTALSAYALTCAPDAMITSGWAPGTGHFMDLFHAQLQKFLVALTAKAKPRKVLVCMIYYPDEAHSDSWADRTLGALGYDRNPAKLQLIIRSLFQAIQRKGFDVPGVPVELVPLFEVLDPKDPADYECRVEPSVQGGQKMAAAFMDRIFSSEEGGAAQTDEGAAAAPPAGAAAEAEEHKRK